MYDSEQIKQTSASQFLHFNKVDLYSRFVILCCWWKQPSTVEGTSEVRKPHLSSQSVIQRGPFPLSGAYSLQL